MNDFSTPSERGRNAKAAIEHLKRIEDPFVNADLLAPCMGMSPSVLRKHVRDGEYKLSAYDIQGGRIRFSRKDFLQKIGEIPPDSPEKTVEQQLLETLKDIREMLICMMTSGQALVYAMRRDKKTADAATPTD